MSGSRIWTEEVVLSARDLQTLCARWQQVLRLQDWNVLVRLVREEDMENGRCGGEVDWVLVKKCARINMLDPVDYGKSPWVPQDQEVDLVHELIHLHFAPLKIKDDSPEDKALEFAIEAMAQALVALDREAKHDR